MREKLYSFLMLLTRAKVKYQVEVINSFKPLSGKPVIYAANHSAFQDIPIALRAIGKHSYTLVGKQNLGIFDRIFFALIGVIWVDRKDRESRGVAKENIIEYLKKDCSILWFPEATWNLTANLLMLPMWWGIIEVAYQTEAQIIPMALDYDRTKMVCRVKFGIPMSGDELTDKEYGIQMLRDALATLRLELMGDKVVLSRRQTDIAELRKEVESAIDEYPTIDWKYEVSCIYQSANKRQEKMETE